jgi:hypothetical protein
MEGNNPKVIENSEGIFSPEFLMIKFILRHENHTFSGSIHRRWPKTGWSPSEEIGKF